MQGEPATDAEETAVEDTNVTDSGLTGALNATLDNATVIVGVPFNLTLDFVGDANASTLAWTVELRNATDVVAAFNGTGLPAIVELNATQAGNHTIEAAAMQGNDTVVAPVLDVVVIDLPMELGDPCEGVGPQDTFTKRSLAYGGVLGTGFYTSNPFEVGPCQTKMTITLTPDTVGDFMIRFFGPDVSSTTVDEGGPGDAEVLVYEPGGYITPGTWNANRYGALVVADYWTLTVEFG